MKDTFDVDVTLQKNDDGTLNLHFNNVPLLGLDSLLKEIGHPSFAKTLAEKIIEYTIGHTIEELEK